MRNDIICPAIVNKQYIVTWHIPGCVLLRHPQSTSTCPLLAWASSSCRGNLPPVHHHWVRGVYFTITKSLGIPSVEKEGLLLACSSLLCAPVACNVHLIPSSCHIKELALFSAFKCNPWMGSKMNGNAQVSLQGRKLTTSTATLIHVLCPCLQLAPTHTHCFE